MSKISEEVAAATSVPSANEGDSMYNNAEFKPYVEAEKVDKLINKLASKHPVTKENLNLWTLYHRTIQSTLTLMEKELEKVADAPT